MNDNQIHKIISDLNSNTYKWEIFFKQIAPNIIYAKTWIPFPDLHTITLHQT